MIVKTDIPYDYGYTTPFPQGGNLKQQIFGDKSNETPLQEQCTMVSQREFYNLVKNNEILQKQVQELQRFKKVHGDVFSEISLLSKVSRWILIIFCVLYVGIGISVGYYFLCGQFDNNNVSSWANYVLNFIGVGGVIVFGRFMWNAYSFDRRLKKLENKFEPNGDRALDNA